MITKESHWRRYCHIEKSSEISSNECITKYIINTLTLNSFCAFDIHTTPNTFNSLWRMLESRKAQLKQYQCTRIQDLQEEAGKCGIFDESETYFRIFHMI